MSISSNFLISQLRTWFWSLGSLDSGLPPPRVPPHMPPPAPNAPARTLTVAPRGPWGSPEAPRLQVSEGPGWAPAVSGRVEGLRRAEGGSPPEAVVSCGVARQRILGIRGKTGCLWGRDPYSAAPTALPGSTERTTVPSVSHSGHALSVLPHSLPHPVSPISEARAPLPLTACACPPCQQLPCCPRGCQQPWNQQQKLISKEHLTPRWDRQGSGCRRRLPPALHHPASATGSSASEEPRPPGGRPPSAPEYSLVPLFLAH